MSDQLIQNIISVYATFVIDMLNQLVAQPAYLLCSAEKYQHSVGNLTFYPQTKGIYQQSLVDS